MDLFLRIILGAGGVLLVFMASSFLVDPSAAGADFGLSAQGAHGLTSLRTDFTSFFGVSGACLIWGAWQKRRDPLLIGGALMLVALAARMVSLGINGSFDGFIPPISTEAVLGIAALVGANRLPKSAA